MCYQAICFCYEHLHPFFLIYWLFLLLTGITVVCVTTGASVFAVSTQRPLVAGERLLVSPRRDKSSTCKFLYNALCFSLEFGIWTLAKSLLGYFCIVCIWTSLSRLLEIYSSYKSSDGSASMCLLLGSKFCRFYFGLIHQIWVLFYGDASFFQFPVFDIRSRCGCVGFLFSEITQHWCTCSNWITGSTVDGYFFYMQGEALY